MSRWGYGGYPYYAPSRPRKVENGIKLKSRRGEVGSRWWSRRWIQVLESFHLGARLDRGKSYARQGQVTELNITVGNVSAKVQGSARSPYRVSITLQPLSQQEWQRIIEAMASQAKYAAKLLAGEMPDNIEEVFIVSQIPLFPTKNRDLKTDCSCPDSANPCKHIAAVYFILAEKFEEDPFMIFKLRGMGKEEILGRLRESRSGDQPPTKNIGKPTKRGRNEKRVKIVNQIDKRLTNFWQGTWGPVPFRISPPLIENAILKRLGPSPFTINQTNAAALLEKIYSHVLQSTLSLVAEEKEDEDLNR
jgi:uncharacterized Zn finger protein